MTWNAYVPARERRPVDDDARLDSIADWLDLVDRGSRNVPATADNVGPTIARTIERNTR